MHDKKLVHTTHIPVRWCDMDSFIHVNNSVFFTYFEIARIEWWRQAHPVGSSLQDAGPVLVTANCTFLKPVIYPETLLVNLYVGAGGRSSYECYYEIFSANDDSLKYAEGNTKVVWVDRKSGKSIPLPDYVRELLP